MQRSFDPSLSWPHVVYLAVAGILGYFFKKGHGWIVLWMNRKRPAADVELSEAQAHKTRAEARKINAEADVEFANIVEKLHTRIDQMQVAAEKVRGERDELKMRVDLQQIELAHRDVEIKKYMAILELNKIKPSDYDKPKSDGA